MAETDVQNTIGPEPAAPPLEHRAEELVAATAQTNAPARVAAETTAPGPRPPSQAHAAAPGYATHRPAGVGSHTGDELQGGWPVSDTKYLVRALSLFPDKSSASGRCQRGG